MRGVSGRCVGTSRWGWDDGGWLDDPLDQAKKLAKNPSSPLWAI